jgi:hypothetical protein
MPHISGRTLATYHKLLRLSASYALEAVGTCIGESAYSFAVECV